MTDWDAAQLREVISESLRAFPAVGAPATWVLSNHDVVRHASRLALTAENPQGHGIGPASPGQPIPDVGLRRARAATMVMLALPGSAYLYQGEELGLPEVIDLPDDARQDPTWFRTDHERYGRDGCRVPLPWDADAPGYGFSPTGASWLPQPAEWATLARSVQETDPESTLWLYRTMLAVRRDLGLGGGRLEWLDGFGDDVIAFRVHTASDAVTVVANAGSAPVALPAGTLLAASEPFDGDELPVDTAVWLSTR
jgi:alpha-glucosidase